MGRFRCIPFVISIAVCSAFGQNDSVKDSTAVLLGMKGHFGSILPHSRSIAQLTGSYIWGFSADLSRIRYTKDSWNSCNCYSQNGISLAYFNFNNRTVLGSAISLALFAEPQLTYGRISLSLRGGAGISYLTRVYHPETNPENLFFSDPWSGVLLAGLTARYRPDPAWLVRLGASYSHISNGGKRQPNKGMNFPTVEVGVDYTVKHAPFVRRKKNRWFDPSIRYYAGLFYNTRAVELEGVESEEREMTFGLQGGFYKPFARLHAVGAAIEALHDGALKVRAQANKESFDHHVISALVRHHFLFGKFDFSQALGIYLHKEYPTADPVFQRYALHYSIAGKLQAGFSLKAHLHTAEQMDVRIRVVFDKPTESLPNYNR